MQESFLTPLLRKSETRCVLQNERNGRMLADRVVPALDSRSRREGLLKRDTFVQGEALVIAPTNAIHMFFMRFAIDVAFLRRDGEVVKVAHGLKPWRMAAALRAHLVVELPSGTLVLTDTRPGDKLVLIAAR